MKLIVPFAAPWPDLEGTPPCLNMLMYKLGVDGLAFIDVYVLEKQIVLFKCSEWMQTKAYVTVYTCYMRF